jgi:diguanylate cyclase (GGDEF)-like protein
MKPIASLLFYARELPSRMIEALREQYIYIFTSSLSLPVQQRRIAVIQSRLRFLMTLMAIGILAWSVLDYYAFPRSLWLSLLLARVLAGASLIGFLVFGDRLFRKSIGKLWHVYLQLGIVFVVPTLFYVYCVRLPEPLFEPNSFTAAIANLYSLVPFLLLACIGLFPLTAIESTTVVTPFLTAYYLTAPKPIAALWSTDFGMMWVMALLAIISIVICYSQLHMLVQLVSFSSYDFLTNCLHRRSGEEIVRVLWHLSLRKKSNLAVAFVDLDHFKRVNDRFGHEEGDRVLAHTASVLRDVLRKSDSVIRWGGEEFLVVLPDTDIENASIAMQRVAQKGFGTLPDGSIQTVSVGIAERLSEPVADEKHLIRIADERLYKAKMSGRSRIVGAKMVIVKP